MGASSSKSSSAPSQEVFKERDELRNQIGVIRRELENTRKAADVYQEEAEKGVRAKTEELENTRKAALVFMGAADAYQEVAEKQIKAKAEELEDTRKAALVFMDAADAYQEAAEKQAKEKAEELEDTRKAALVFMDIIADMYQHGHEENVEVLGDQTAAMDASLESMLLEAIDKLRLQILTAKQKHGVPRAEVVNRISMELGAILVEANKTTFA